MNLDDLGEIFCKVLQLEFDRLAKIDIKNDLEKKRKKIKELRRINEMKYDIIFKKALSKKTNKYYYVAYIDLGYRKHIVTMNKNEMAELLGCHIDVLDENIEVEPP